MGTVLTVTRQQRELQNRLLGEFASVDALEQELVRLEGLVSRVRARRFGAPGASYITAS